MTWPWLLVCLAVFLIGLTKSGFGSGASLVIVPITAFAMDKLPGYGTEAALALLLPLLIAGDFVAVWQYRKHFSRRIVIGLLPGTLIGVLLGTLLLRWFLQQQRAVAEALVNIDIGFESVFLVLLHWYRVWRARGQIPPYRPAAWRRHLTGVFAGASSTLAHAAGPIIALHLLSQRLERGVFVGTCALYFAILNAAKFPTYWSVGLFQRASPELAAMFLPLILLGALSGLWLNRRLTDETFSRIVYALAFVMGWYILIRGVIQLSHAWP